MEDVDRTRCTPAAVEEMRLALHWLGIDWDSECVQSQRREAHEAALDRLADDDPNPNSVFTRSLIPLMQKPGMSLVQAARTVRRDVQKLAATVPHDQRPAYYDEVMGDFFRNVLT